MKGFTIISALVASAFIGITAAQSGIPTCVLQCSEQAASAAGCSGITDVQCVCTSATFQNDAGACLQANCSTSDQQAASALQNATCVGLSVTSGSVTATIASATGATSINTASVSASLASNTSMMMSSTGSMSMTGSMSGSMTGSMSGSAAATSAASASASAKSSASALHLGTSTFFGAGLAVVGAALGAVMVL